MECRRLEINLLSAYDLENVREFFKMKVYAVVSISSISNTKKQTPVDYQGGTNPAWNFTVKYTIAELAVLEQTGVKILVKLYCKRTLGDRYVGEVQASIKELYDNASEKGGSAILSFPVTKDSEESQGMLNFWCKFGNVIAVHQRSIVNKVVATGVMASLRMFFMSRMGVDLPIGTPSFTENAVDWAPTED